MGFVHDDFVDVFIVNKWIEEQERKSLLPLSQHALALCFAKLFLGVAAVLCHALNADGARCFGMGWGVGDGKRLKLVAEWQTLCYWSHVRTQKFCLSFHVFIIE